MKVVWTFTEQEAKILRSCERMESSFKDAGRHDQSPQEGKNAGLPS